MSKRALLIVAVLAALITTGVSVMIAIRANRTPVASTNGTNVPPPDRSFGKFIVAKDRPVVTSTTVPEDALWSYQGTWSLSSLTTQFPILQGVKIRTIAFREDRALFGGDGKRLFLYDGSTVQDLSDLIAGETDEERANPWPSVSHIAATPKNWVISVWGSGYNKLYVYDGAVKRVFNGADTPLGYSPMSSSLWNGSALLIGYGSGGLLSFDGSAFAVLRPNPTVDWTVYGSTVVAGNGSEYLVFVPDGTHHLYRLDGTTLVEIPDPDFRGMDGNPTLLQTMAWNGEYWLAVGGKRIWKYQNGSWSTLTALSNQVLRNIVLNIGWSGRYWLISDTERVFLYDGTTATDITQDLQREGFSRWAESIAFGSSYGLIGAAGGSNGGVIRLERKRVVSTVNSEERYACYTPSGLKSVPGIDALLTSVGFTERTFTDLCISTNGNPQQQFLVLRTAETRTDPRTEQKVACRGCFEMQPYSLRSGAPVVAASGPFVTGASECAFAGAETDEYQQNLLRVDCALTPVDEDHRYFNRYFVWNEYNTGTPGFDQQCSLWRSDLTEPVLDGEQETTLTFPTQEVTTRCGNTKRIPLQEDWATYSSDGFTFRYPRTWYMRATETEGKTTFDLHPRNLGSIEGGGPFNPFLLELLPALSQDDAFRLLLTKKGDRNDEYARVEKVEVNGLPAVRYVSGPGMCGDNPEVYLIGTTRALHYQVTCGSWENIDQTFRLE